jgi:hypothetical protein
LEGARWTGAAPAFILAVFLAYLAAGLATLSEHAQGIQ